METYRPYSADRLAPAREPEPLWISPFSREIFCLVFLLVWGMLFLSMWSWNDSDPAFSHVRLLQDEQIQNWLGRVGAYSADLMFTLFGAGSWVLMSFSALVLFRLLMRLWRKIVSPQSFFYRLKHGAAWCAVIFSFQGLLFWMSQADWLNTQSAQFATAGVAGVVGQMAYALASTLDASLAFFVLWVPLLWGLVTALNFSWWRGLVYLGRWIEYSFMWCVERIRTKRPKPMPDEHITIAGSAKRSLQSLRQSHHTEPASWSATTPTTALNTQHNEAMAQAENQANAQESSDFSNSSASAQDLPDDNLPWQDEAIFASEDFSNNTTQDSAQVSHFVSPHWRANGTDASSVHTPDPKTTSITPLNELTVSNESEFVNSAFTADNPINDTVPAQIQPPPVIKPRFVQAVAPNEQSNKALNLPRVNPGDLPPLSLLDPPAVKQEKPSEESLGFTARLIEKKLSDFGIEVKVVNAIPGPVITRFEIEPAVGVKGSQVVNLARDLARSLSIVSVRVLETIPGKNCMGLELPNTKRQMVRLTEILSVPEYLNHSSPLAMGLGQDIAGVPVVVDLAKMPHLLVAGTTGSGKSVGVNAMLLSLLFRATPQDVRLILIDPKMLELSIYDGIPHLLTPVVTDMKDAHQSLAWSVGEMERRYRLMSKLGVRNLAGYNQKVLGAIEAGTPLKNPLVDPSIIQAGGQDDLSTLPMIVIVIDELADLMMVVGKKVEELIARLAQKARAAGIHLILATQRPSVDVITGLIKANVPTRLAFQVSSKIDSRTILDQMGAESLLGQGDMLFMPPGTGTPLRAHGAFVADDEVHRVVEFLKQTGEPDYIESILETESADASLEGGNTDGESDELYDRAVAIVLENKRASISLVQRHLRIGYNRAARLLEQMEKSGLVSNMRSNGNRDILVNRDSI